MTEQRKWPDSWQWVDEEAAAKAVADPRGLIERMFRSNLSSADIGALVAVLSTKIKPSERGPTNAEIIAEARNSIIWGGDAYENCQNVALKCLELQADISWFKPEPDQTTLLLNELASTVGGFNAKYSIVKRYFAEALAVPPDVEDAARWIFDNAHDWTDLAKANAQKLAEYALRGKR